MTKRVVRNNLSKKFKKKWIKLLVNKQNLLIKLKINLIQKKVRKMINCLRNKKYKNKKMNY